MSSITKKELYEISLSRDPDQDDTQYMGNVEITILPDIKAEITMSKTTDAMIDLMNSAAKAPQIPYTVQINGNTATVRIHGELMPPVSSFEILQRFKASENVCVIGLIFDKSDIHEIAPDLLQYDIYDGFKRVSVQCQVEKTYIFQDKRIVNVLAHLG